MLRIACVSFILATFCTPSFGQTEAGVIKTSRGTAQITRGTETLPATVGSAVLVSDSVVTGDDSAVGPNTTLELNKFSFDTTTHAGTVDASVKRGSLAVISGKIAKGSPEGIRFNTPTVTLGVRGTEFIIDVGE